MKDPVAFLEQHRQLQAAGADPVARGLIDAMKGQLLIVLIERLGGEVRIPVAEVDGTGGKILSLQVDGTDFVFVVGAKH